MYIPSLAGVWKIYSPCPVPRHSHEAFMSVYHVLGKSKGKHGRVYRASRCMITSINGVPTTKPVDTGESECTNSLPER
jgi:hypothetical protein